MFAKLITGKNHIKKSEVCQDNWRAYYSINNKLTILVLSDGAGSSKKVILVQNLSVKKL